MNNLRNQDWQTKALSAVTVQLEAIITHRWLRKMIIRQRRGKIFWKNSTEIPYRIW